MRLHLGKMTRIIKFSLKYLSNTIKYVMIPLANIFGDVAYQNNIYYYTILFNNIIQYYAICMYIYIISLPN